MKCPILIKVTKRWFRPPVYEPMDCLGDKCAWWVGGDRVCVISGIRRELCDIHYLLRDIKDKMPPGQPFVK